MNTNIYSDDMLLALEEVDAVYRILQDKYPGTPALIMAAMLTGVLTRIDSDKTVFTAIESTHREKRVWHPKYGFGKVKSFDDNKKAIIDFDDLTGSIKLSPKVIILAEDMNDVQGKAMAAAEASLQEKSAPGASAEG